MTFLTFLDSNKTTTIEATLPSPVVSVEDFEFQLPVSTLGAYSKAAVATDTRPCAKIGT